MVNFKISKNQLEFTSIMLEFIWIKLEFTWILQFI